MTTSSSGPDRPRPVDDRRHVRTAASPASGTCAWFAGMALSGERAILTFLQRDGAVVVAMGVGEDVRIALGRIGGRDERCRRLAGTVVDGVVSTLRAGGATASRLVVRTGEDAGVWLRIGDRAGWRHQRLGLVVASVFLAARTVPVELVGPAWVADAGW